MEISALVARVESSQPDPTKRQELLNELYYLVQIKDSQGDRIAVEVLQWAIQQILDDTH